MASQVLSGSSNVSYTNNTGQNVRIVINFMRGVTGIDNVGSLSIGMSWAGVSVTGTLAVIGRNLAFNNLDSISAGTLSSNNALGNSPSLSLQTFDGALPTELMLAPGQTFSASCGAYNIVVIPEAG